MAFNHTKNGAGLLDSGRWAFFCRLLVLILVLGWGDAQAENGTNPITFPDAIVTQALELRRVASRSETSFCDIRIEGVVVYVNPAQDELIIQDASGGVAINMDLRDQPEVKAGVGIWLVGRCAAGAGKITTATRMDNDGLHSVISRSKLFYLSAGFHPICVEWFNKSSLSVLTTEWMGSGGSRQRIPDEALFHLATAGETNRMEQGLEYHCYEGEWDYLPDFSKLSAVKKGVANNFDIRERTRNQNVGLVFSGYLKVPKDDRYRIWITSDDGSRLYIDDPLKLRASVLGEQKLPTPLKLRPGQLLDEEQECRWAAVEGDVIRVQEQSGLMSFEVGTATSRTWLKVMNGSDLPEGSLLHSHVRAEGVCRTVFNAGGQPETALLVHDIKQVECEPDAFQLTDNVTNSRPVLTQAIQVKNLTKDEAQQELPAKIRGVITARLGGGYVIQDATWSVFFRFKDNAGSDGWEPDGWEPDVGDYLEIEGGTYMAFAPSIMVNHAQYLGEGVFPEPLKPVRGELINGSLDTQYIEIEGVVTLVEDGDLVLLTRGGKVRIRLLYDIEIDKLQELDGARIRIRGVFSPDRSRNLMMLPQLRLSTVSILLDRPSPEVPFEIPLKRAEDLFHFDVRADLLRRVRISGQVLQQWNGEYFLMDGSKGFRLELKTPDMLHAGDQLEVVGFPDVSGFSPVLRDAQVRKTGWAEFPLPRSLSADTLLNGENDATRISVEADLMGLSEGPDGQVLELRTDTHGFLARLKKEDGRLKNILQDSRVRITGVYLGKGRGRGSKVDSFELLMNSPADITVLKRPSRWTVRHALNLAMGLALLSLGSLVWIIMLRRQVEARSRQLAIEIRRHEQTERRRAMDEERTRIAQDLHDDLGATLTEIRFLSAVGRSDANVSPEIRTQFEEVSEKTRQMVTSLDEIVWAVNPANDSLAGLEAYLHHVVDEFFRGSPIRCRLDVDDALPGVKLTSEVRHNLYLAVREALNNIAKHAAATEAWLRIHWRANVLHIAVEDNGCGFVTEKVASFGNGLQNLRMRLENIGGHFECESRPGSGTACRMTLPLEQTEQEE